MPVAHAGWLNDVGKHCSISLTEGGPTVGAQVGYDSDYNPATGVKPQLPADWHHALIDTGATQSCIDSSVAQKLNLPVVDKQNISGIGGTHTVEVCAAQIHVPTLDCTVHGLFHLVELRAGGQTHTVLLGRTFLQQFILYYDGLDGIVKLAR